MNVDFTVYLYPASNTIEISPYDADNCVEGRKIYCNKDKIFARLNRSEIESQIKERQDLLARQRKTRIPNDLLFEQIARTMVIPYILQRVVIVPPAEIIQPKIIETAIEEVDDDEEGANDAEREDGEEDEESKCDESEREMEEGDGRGEAGRGGAG